MTALVTSSENGVLLNTCKAIVFCGVNPELWSWQLRFGQVNDQHRESNQCQQNNENRKECAFDRCYRNCQVVFPVQFHRCSVMRWLVSVFLRIHVVPLRCLFQLDLLTSKVARGHVTWRVVFDQFGLDLRTFFNGYGASGVKAAARRRVHGTWNIAFEHDTSPMICWVRNGDRHEQGLGVGMKLLLEQFVSRS